MNIQNSVALVTGANRGLGAAFVRALLAGGAAKVYAAARDPASITEAGAIPVRLDVTQAEQIAALARELGDVTLLVNNAGIGGTGPVLDATAIAMLQQQFETNAVGPLRMAQAFAPTLAANQDSAIINVISALSWATLPSVSGSYSATKSAAWALSNAMRQELQPQGTQVLSLHVAFMDTDMTRGVPGAKAAPDDIARMALAALEAGKSELLADDVTRAVHAGLTSEPPMYLGML